MIVISTLRRLDKNKQYVFEITGLKALSYDELPQEYFTDLPYVAYSEQTKKLVIRSDDDSVIHLKIGDVINHATMQKCLQLCYEAGTRLMHINKGTPVVFKI